MKILLKEDLPEVVVIEWDTQEEVTKMVDEDTRVALTTCMRTMVLQCMEIILINLVQDMVEITEDIKEEVTMTSDSNQMTEREEALDNTTIIKVTDTITTTTTNKITSTEIDNNIDTLVNINTCSMVMKTKAHQDTETNLIEITEINTEKVLNKNSEVTEAKECRKENT